MNYDEELIIKFLNDIKEFSDVTANTSEREAFYKLGQIHNNACLCYDHYIKIKKGKEEFEKSLNTHPKVLEVFDNAKNNFEKYCEDESSKIIENDIQFLERTGSHMNLKFELDKRYSSKALYKSVLNILYRANINTMNDFLIALDDPKIFSYFICSSKLVPDDINKKYFIRELSSTDREKLARLYLSANECNHMNHSDNMRKFLGLKNDRYGTRFMNALIRATDVYTINQLYFYLEHNVKSFTEFKKLKGLSNTPMVIENLYYSIMADKK